jgi:hypothetical protein
MPSKKTSSASDRETLSVVVDAVLKEALRSRAARERRRLSDYVRIVLEDAVEEAKNASRGTSAGSR